MAFCVHLLSNWMDYSTCPRSCPATEKHYNTCTAYYLRSPYHYTKSLLNVSLLMFNDSVSTSLFAYVATVSVKSMLYIYIYIYIHLFDVQ